MMSEQTNSPTEEQVPKPPHDLALPKITVQMLGDYGQEGFLEKTDQPVEGVAGITWSQAAVDFACMIVRPAVWAEIERLQADLDLLAKAGCKVREHNGHRFVEIVSDVQP